MKEEILAAVMFLMKFIEKSDSFPRDQIENFKHHLTTLLLERFEKHWFPERPARGQGYRCIRVNGVCPVDGTLERAASRCGLRYRDLRLPQELTIWVDPAEVCYRLGESEGSHCTLATFPRQPGSKGGATITDQTTLNNSSSSTSTLSSDSALSSSSSSTSSGSETGSDCASLSSRSPSPLAAATIAGQQQQQQQQQQQVYQGPMLKRSSFTVNGAPGGGRFVRGVGVMQQQQQQQQQDMSCRTTVNMQQQQRFLVQQQMGTGNRLKPREMGYNVPQHHASTRTTPAGSWRPDGQQPPSGFVPPNMFNPLQHFNHHGGPGQFNNNNNNNNQAPNHFGRNSVTATLGPNGVPTAYGGQQPRMYKNVVRV